LHGEADETLVLAGDAGVLVHHGDDGMPVRGLGKRVMPAESVLFAARGAIARRKDRVIVGGKVSGERSVKQDGGGGEANEPPRSAREKARSHDCLTSPTLYGMCGRKARR
jgi:hypothetical protein